MMQRPRFSLFSVTFFMMQFVEINGLIDPLMNALQSDAVPNPPENGSPKTP